MARKGALPHNIQYEHEDNQDQQKDRMAKRRREDSRIYAIHLYPRNPMQLKGKNIPPIAATEAMAMELVTVWGLGRAPKDSQRGRGDDAVSQCLPRGTR